MCGKITTFAAQTDIPVAIGLARQMTLHIGAVAQLDRATAF